MSLQRPYHENAKCEVSNEILSPGWLSNRSKLSEIIVGVLGQWHLVNIITGKHSRTLQKPKLTEAQEFHSTPHTSHFHDMASRDSKMSYFSKFFLMKLL